MAKIIIDTNEFIDLLKLDYGEIESYMNKIKENISLYIFPQQIIDETIRHVLSSQKCELQNLEDKYKPYEIKICNELKNKEFSDTISKINDGIKKLKKKKNEEVLQKCNKILEVIMDVPCDAIIPTTSMVLEKALNRKTCGNPPSSNSRIGDEIIWESILSWAKDDIVFVSNDHTFHDNFKFLQFEYGRTNRKLLGVYKKLVDAIKSIGQDTDKEIEKIEKKEERLSEKLVNTAASIVTLSDHIKNNINYYSMENLIGDNSIFIRTQNPTKNLYNITGAVNGIEKLGNALGLSSIKTSDILSKSILSSNGLMLGNNKILYSKNENFSPYIIDDESIGLRVESSREKAIREEKRVKEEQGKDKGRGED